MLSDQLDGRRIALAQFLGARPQTPRVGFAEVWASEIFSEAEQRFLFLFLEKENTTRSIKWQEKSISTVSGGTPPDPLGRLRRGLS
jgi:hypothetical protein